MTDQPRTLDHWIGGASVPAPAHEDLASPETGEIVVRVGHGSRDDVQLAVAAAQHAARGWRETPAGQRGRALHDLATSIREHAEELSALERAETGKPRELAATEIEVSASYFEFYGGLANIPMGEVIDAGAPLRAFTRREPFGVIAVITPWNVPLVQAARACAPALAVGNVIVCKPSEFTSSATVRLAQLASECGLPDGVLNVLLGTGPEVGEPLVRDGRVRKVAFTGSVRGGRAVAHAAADGLIPSTLELGGKSANIVFEDADLEAAADRAVLAFTANTGQVCSAGTRLLVQRSVKDRFLELLVPRVERVVADGRMGPLITEAQYHKVGQFLAAAKAEGATALVGGAELPPLTDGSGYYVEPTVFVDVDNEMRTAQDEAFGPILVAMPFEDEDEAVAIANASDYGLVAAVWTRDVARALRIAEQLEAGQVAVNGWPGHSIEVPFGGYKNSGYGREKGMEALHHYTQTKAVMISI